MLVSPGSNPQQSSIWVVREMVLSFFPYCPSVEINRNELKFSGETGFPASYIVFQKRKDCLLIVNSV